MKNTFKVGFVIGVLAVLAVLGYQRLSESQKHYLQQLFRQAPYLIPRYFV